MDSVITDSSGHYGTDILDTGTYNVYGEGKDGRLSLIDSVIITGDTQVVDRDTLKAAASMAGYIKLQPGDEPDKIIAIALGSNNFSLITTAARFSFAGLAEGPYFVRFFSTLDNYSNYDTVFVVSAGENRELGTDSIVMPLKIPIPTGFTVQYNTLKQIVTLFWNRMNPVEVKGYIVHRQRVGSADSLLTPLAITDTFYVDLTGVQDSTYIYRVASVDLGNKEGHGTVGDTVTILSSYLEDGKLGTQGTGDGQFYYLSGIVLTSTGDIFTAEQQIGLGIDRIQRFGSDLIFQTKWGNTGDSIGDFRGLNDIAIYNDSLLLTTETGIPRIQIFTINGNFVDTILTSNGVNWIDVSDSIFYLADNVNFRIQKYTIRGDSILAWNFPESEASKISVDTNGIVYLGNNLGRLFIYSSQGGMIDSLDLTQLGIKAPYNLFALDQESIFVTDYDNNLVWGINAQGNVLFKLSINTHPKGIWVDKNATLFVFTNTQIQKYLRR
jgi:hypothetical protein